MTPDPIESRLYDSDDTKICCRLCNHYCTILPGRSGICRVRRNIDGQMAVLNAGRLVAQSIDPIEKKPIYHLLPGSASYSIAGVGCNFKCTFCQNAHIAQVSKEALASHTGAVVSPDQIVRDAIQSGCQSIAYTYTEPTVFFEIAYETAKLARDAGLHNIFVTNGYMSTEALDLILPYMSAANVDLKAFNDQFYKKHCNGRLGPVKKNIEIMKDAGILVELTTLLIPGLNDSKDQLKKMAGYISESMGPGTPWHISRFHPSHRMMDRGPTPAAALENAWQIGNEAGLRYVYIGNLPGSDHENTVCHQCGRVLIERYGYQTRDFLEDEGKCPDCGAKAWGIF